MQCSALLVVAFASLGHARRLHRNDADDFKESEVSALPSLSSLLAHGPATAFSAGLHAPRFSNQRAAAAAMSVESAGAEDVFTAIAPYSAGVLGLSAAATVFLALEVQRQLTTEEETEFDYVDPKVIGTPEDPIANFNADRKPGPVGPGNRQAGEIVFGKQGAAFVKPGFRRKRPVSPFRAVEAFKVLEFTSNQGLLSKLEKEGVFSKIEPYLPLLDKYNLLSLAERGLQMEPGALSNLGAALLVTTASLILTVPDSDVAIVLLQVLVALVGGAGAVALLGASNILNQIQSKKGVRWGQAAGGVR